MGGTDYIFGGMTAVFYKSELAMNTSENNNDVSYITAAQQSSGRGYLMYECKVTSAEPEIETASLPFLSVTATLPSVPFAVSGPVIDTSEDRGKPIRQR